MLMVEQSFKLGVSSAGLVSIDNNLYAAALMC